jgi:hypothetical protein
VAVALVLLEVMADLAGEVVRVIILLLLLVLEDLVVEVEEAGQVALAALEVEVEEAMALVI